MLIWWKEWIPYEIYIQIDRSYFGIGPVEAEILPGKSGGLVQAKMDKSGGKNE